MKALEKERGRQYVGLPEFTQVSARILAELALEQQRGTVTAVPDERTVRYYLAEGLIQSPEEKKGTASVFNYLQLLQLVVLKKLQAEHLPIRKIRELVAGKNESDLENLLGVGHKSKRNEEKRYLESLLTRPAGPGAITRPGAPRQMDEAPLAHAKTEAAPSWQRVEIEPGLELHV